MNKVIFTTMATIMFIMAASLALAQRNEQNYTADTPVDEIPFYEWTWLGDQKPFLEASIGYGKPKHVKMESEFTSMGTVEGKIGYSVIREFKKNIPSIDQRYLFGSLGRSDWDPFAGEENPFENGTGVVDTKMYRVGVGYRLGFGYSVGPFALFPYSQWGLDGTKVEPTRPDSLSENDNNILDRYEGEWRFGTLVEGGVKFQIFKSLAAIGSVEAQVIFPRTIFWEWVGSAVIQYGARALLTQFSADIVQSNSILGPILYFLLQNGVSYAFYTALQENSHWPFESEAPLTTESAKLGASITF